MMSLIIDHYVKAVTGCVIATHTHTQILNRHNIKELRNYTLYFKLIFLHWYISMVEAVCCM